MNAGSFSSESLEAFVDLVVPERQSRGRPQDTHREGALHEKLFPGSGPLLHDTHPGANFRSPAALATRTIRSGAWRLPNGKTFSHRCRRQHDDPASIIAGLASSRSRRRNFTSELREIQN
jgi:hypothetical protein